MSSEELFYPNRWALIVLSSAEEIVGDLSTLTMWGSVVSNNNDTSANFPLIGAIFSDAGGSASATGIISGTWTSSGATSSLDITLWVSAPNFAAGSTMSAEKPVVIIDYKPGSYCGEVQNPINPQGPSQAAVHCPAPGDINRLLTPDGDCDGDGMTNQRRIGTGIVDGVDARLDLHLAKFTATRVANGVP